MNRSGRCAGAILLGVPGDAAGVLGGSTGHVEQNDDAIRVQLPQRRHALAALEFFEFGVDASGNRDHADQRSGHIGTQALLFEEAGAVGIGFRRSQREVEEPHRYDLAIFRVSHAHEHANRLFHPAKLAFLHRDLLRGNRGRLEHGRSSRTFGDRSLSGFGRRGSASVNPSCARGGSQQRLADGRPAIQFLLQFRYAAKLLLRAVIGGTQHICLLNRGHVLDSNFHSVDRAQDAATHFFECVGKCLDLSQRLFEELVKTGAKSRVVGGDRGQHSGMVKRRIQPLFQFAHPRNDARVHQRIEVAEARNLFPQGIESPQQLHMLLRQ